MNATQNNEGLEKLAVLFAGATIEQKYTLINFLMAVPDIQKVQDKTIHFGEAEQESLVNLVVYFCTLLDVDFKAAVEYQQSHRKGIKESLAVLRGLNEDARIVLLLTAPVFYPTNNTNVDKGSFVEHIFNLICLPEVEYQKVLLN